MLAILSKSIAIIESDTAEKSIADSDSDTSKVSPIVSLSIAIMDISNPAVSNSHPGMTEINSCIVTAVL
jgi:hypothetical protein